MLVYQRVNLKIVLNGALDHSNRIFHISNLENQGVWVISGRGSLLWWNIQKKQVNLLGFVKQSWEVFGFECDVPQYPEIWEFPKSWGYPCSSSIYSWIFHEINHPAIGGTPIVGNLHISKNVHPSSLRVEEASLEWGLVAPSRPFRSFCKKMRFCLTHSTRGGSFKKSYWTSQFLHVGAKAQVRPYYLAQTWSTPSKHATLWRHK